MIQDPDETPRMSARRSRRSERRRGLRAALLLGLAAGVLGVLLSHWPPAETLEMTGLDILFKLRGPRDPPAGIAVVAIDQRSSEELKDFGTRESPTWPRSLHAELIRTLKN